MKRWQFFFMYTSFKKRYCSSPEKHFFYLIYYIHRFGICNSEKHPPHRRSTLDIPNLAPFGRQIIDCPDYQGIGSRSLKKPPLGPPSGSMASQMGVSAPCWGDSGASSPPKSVLTQPGHAEFTRMLSSRTSCAISIVMQFSAVLDRRYAGVCTIAAGESGSAISVKDPRELAKLTMRP